MKMVYQYSFTVRLRYKLNLAELIASGTTITVLNSAAYGWVIASLKLTFSGQ